ncbi:MAG: hypothetical protein M1828_000601 [Chrysothrix sp. TS-e1954]|nr:MAG: hypothetical protein M1828_000601 [Chrysothrix sp. TS-e1954]
MADLRPHAPSILTYQPFKLLWSTLYITFSLTRLPLLFLYYLPRFNRQNSTYTLAQAIRIRIIRSFLYNAALVRMRVPESLKPGKEKERFVVIKPTSTTSYTGVAACDPETIPQPLGATWYPSPPAPTTSPSAGSGPEDVKAVILHFHGGAYAIGDGRTEDCGYAAKTSIAQTRATHMLAPQYRLASNGTRFPGQLQDAISAYAYLLNDLGIPASNIIVAGDSAGGNLALSLLRYLADEGAAAGLPTPAAALLWSPWPSPVSILKDPSSFYRNPNAGKDIITNNFGLWGASVMLPKPEVARKSGEASLEHPAIDFLGNKGFRSDCPMFVSAGECELLCSDVIRMYEGLREVNGGKVVLDVMKGCPHDCILIGDKLGFDEEAQEGARRAGRWLEEVM